MADSSYYAKKKAESDKKIQDALNARKARTTNAESSLAKRKEESDRKIADALSARSQRVQNSLPDLLSDIQKALTVEIDSYKGTKPTYGAYEDTYKNQRERRLNISKLRDRVKAYSSYMDDGAADSIISTLDQMEKGYDAYLGMSEFESEDAYKSAVEKWQKYYDEWGHYSDEADFEEYAGKGASIQNPAFSEAQGWALGPWRWGNEDVGNIVTFSRDNYNDIVGYSEGGRYDVVGNLLYNNMTDDEVKMYNYLLAKQGKEAADSYLSYLEPQLKQTEGQRVGKLITDIDIPVLEDLAVLGYGFGAGVDQWASGVRQFFTDEEQSPSVTQHANAYIAESLDGFGSYAHQAATTIGNMAPSILVSSVTAGLGAPAVVAQGLGAATVGVSAAGNAYSDALSKGYDKESARAYSTLVGASEGVLQYLIGGVSSLGGMSGKLASKIAAIDSSLLRISAKMGASIGSEIFEEELQNFLEPAFRTWIFGEEYDMPTLDALIETAIVTAMSTGMLEGGGTIGGDIKNSKYYKSTYGDSVQDLVLQGIESPEGSLSHDLASKYQARLDAGKTINGHQIGRMVEANEQQFRSEDMASIQSAAESRLAELGETGDVSAIAAALTKQAAGEKLSRAEQQAISGSKYGQRVANELNTENIQSGDYSSEWAQKLDTNRINVDEYSRLVEAAQLPQETAEVTGKLTGKESLQVAEESPATVRKNRTVEQTPETQYEVSVDGKTIDREGNVIDIVGVDSIKDGKMVLKTETGTIDSSEVQYATEADALVYEAVSKLGASPASAWNMIKGFKESDGISAQDYATLLPLAYKYGKINYRNGLLNLDLTPKQSSIAFQMGREDASAAVKPTTQASAKSTLSEKNADKKIIFEGFTYNEKSANDVQKASMAAIDTINKMSSLEIHVYQSVKKNGKLYAVVNGKERLAPNGYFTDGNKIYIDINAGNKGEGMMLYTLSHEIGHYIARYDAQDFKAISDFLFEHYGKDVPIDTLLENQKNKLRKSYETDGKTIPSEAVLENEAKEELVCDMLSRMMADKNAYDKLMALKQKDLNAFQKLGQAIKKALEKLAKIIGVYDIKNPDFMYAASVENFGEEAFRQLQDLYVRAFVQADANFQAAEKSTTEDGGVNEEYDIQLSPREEDAFKPYAKEINSVINQAIAGKGHISGKVQVKEIMPVGPRLAAMVAASSGNAIDISRKSIALNSGEIWHEYDRHTDVGDEISRGQIAFTKRQFQNAVKCIISPDFVETIFSSADNPTQNQSFAYVKKTVRGSYVVVEAVGGKRSPYIYPVMILQFSKAKWNKMMAEGKTLGEILLENDPKKLKALDIEQNKKSRVSAAQFASYEAIANTLRSSQLNTKVSQSDPIVNTQSVEAMDIEVDEKTESVAPSVLMSERTWTESDYVQEREQAAKEIAKAIGVSVKKAEAYIDSVNSIAKMIAEDRVRLDYFSSPGRSSFVGNVEYGGRFDFSTLCKKRRLLTGTFTAIQKALPNTALTADEILDIRNRMKDAGHEVSCGLCYVEGSRANMGQFAKEFLRLYKQYYPDAWQPNMADVNTPDGIEWVRINHPECYEQYEYFWNHYGTLKDGDKNLFASQQKPKLYQLHTEYKGEILEKFNDDDNVEEKNLNGGIRLQSFSDFEIVHLIDTMQIIMDMSRVGLAGQAYTKVPDFAWALGDTGLKINLSLIAKGVDENGRLIFDDVEGMPIDKAVELRNRYSKNVGTILVAFNDEQLLAAMADERVDYIIPFHRSQWKKSQYGAMGLPVKTKDYTYMQNEKFIKPQYHEYRGRMVKDKATNYMPNEYWDFSKSGKENAEAYLEMCARNNKRPKFYKLLQNNGDGSYSLKADGSTDGYWKLLIDFKMYDNNGVGSPQMPVKPDFNMDETTRMLDEYSGGHSNFPVAQGVVDSFVEEYKDSHEGVQYSDRDSDGNQLSAEQQEFFKDSKVRDKKGNLLTVYHGTTANFNIFKKGDVGFHFGTRGAARGRVGYGKNVNIKAVYLNITNPIVFDEDLGSWDADYRLTRELYDRGILTKDEAMSVLRTDDGRYKRSTEAANKKLADVLIAKGYDGIAYQNTFETKKATTSYIAFSSNQAKETTNLSPTSNPDIRYSDRDNVPTFYSQMARVVDGVKQEKLGAASVVSMLRGKGVKAEEIKWSGIETWLEGKKSVTKAELQEFIAGSMLQIEEEVLDNKDRPYTEDQQKRLDEYEAKRDDVANRLADEWKKLTGEEFPIRNAGAGLESAVANKVIDANKEHKDASFEGRLLKKLRKDLQGVIENNDDFGFDSWKDALRSIHRHRRDFISYYEMSTNDKAIIVKYCNALNAYNELPNMISDEDTDRLRAIARETDPWNRKIMEVKHEHNEEEAKYMTNWRQYSLEGGKNYREMLFRIPGSTYSNAAMFAHWKERKGVLAHARVQDIDTFLGKTLFIEEIQSDWHNAGHKDGYRDPGVEDKHTLSKKMEKYTEEFYASPIADVVRDRIAPVGYEGAGVSMILNFLLDSQESMESTLNTLSRKGASFSESEVSEIAKYAREYEEMYHKWETAPGDLTAPDAPFKDTYHEYVLKRLVRMAAEQDYDSIGWTTADIQMERWNPKRKTNAQMGITDAKNPNAVAFEDGYRIEYDQDMPKFMSKLGKKWGTSVGKTVLDNGTEVWSMAITDAMKESVMTEGQPLYQDRPDDSVSNRSLLANAFEGVAQNEIERNKIREYREKVTLIDAEERNLNELNEQIKELSFAKGPRDTKKIRDLQFEARQTANRISTYDKQLLRLEASKPLQDVLTREKKMAYKRAEQKGKEALAAYKERAAKTQRELLDKWQDSRKKGIDSRHRTAMRHKIKDIVNELNQYLLRGTKDRHVPIELQKAVAEALDAVNMDTVGAEERIAKLKDELLKAKTPEQIQEISRKIDHIQAMGDKMNGRLQKLKDAYDQFVNSDDPLIANSHDEVISNKLQSVIDSIGNTPLRDMTLNQLEDVYDMYRMVLTTIRNANKAFKAKKSESISTIANQVMVEVEKVGGKQKQSLAMLNGIKSFGWNNLKPVYAFEHIGSDHFTEVFNNVRAGEDVWAVDVTEAREFYLDKSKKYNYDSWDLKKRHKFTSTSGMDFELDIEQIMSLYAYSKRDQAADHLSKGGIVFDESTKIIKKTKVGISLEFNPTEATAYNISEETLADIVSKLTDEQKGFVDEMQDYLSTVMGAKGNEVSLEMYGVKLFKEKFYFPLKSAQQFMAKAKEQQKGEVKIKNSGFSKETVQKASNPIVLTPFMNVWAEHVNEMSMYHAFVLPMEDFYRVYNYKTPTSDTMATESVEMFLQNAYGKGATKYIDQLLRDLNGGARTDSTTGFINKMLGLFKKGSVFASLSVVVQQPSAIARAAALVDTKYFIGPKVDHKRHKALWSEVKQYAPVAIIKEMGYFDTNMGKSTQDFIMGKEYSGFKDKMSALVKDSSYRDEVLSKAPALADEIAWCGIWEAVKRETKAKNPGVDVKSDSFLKMAGERFTEVVTKTQVYDSVLSRSGLMRSKDTGMKMATAFMAEPTTSINMVADALLQGKRGNRKYARAAIGAVIASQILNSILVSFVYAGRDDDEDETYLEKYIGTLTGEVLDSLNPASYIPFIKDIVSIVQGYDVERSDMAVVSDLWNAWENLRKDNVSAYRKVEGFAGSVAQIFGLPVKNIMRDARGIYQTVMSFVDGEHTTAAGIGHAVKGSVTGKDVSDSQQLYEAYLNGDAGQIARVKSRFDDQNAINNAVRKALRENDPRIQEAAIAWNENDLDEYMRIAREIIAEKHFVQDDVVMAIRAEANALVPDAESETKSKAKGLFTAEKFAEAIAQGNQAMANAIKTDIIQAAAKNGKTTDEAEKSFNSSAKTELKELFLSGDISEQKAINALVTYCGSDEDGAKADVQYWAFKQDYPDVHADDQWFDTYYEKVADSGLDIGVYMEYRNTVSTITGEGKKEKRMAVINSLPITSAQKDALYFSEGWTSSKLYEAPWH